MTPPSFLDLVQEYLAFRRGLGFDLKTEGWMLIDFARYADRTGHDGHVTTDLAVRWALTSSSRDLAGPARRLSAVRPFARHRAAFDPATEVPPAGLLGYRPRRKQPHIYSDAEVSSLLMRIPAKWKGQFGPNGRVGSEQVARARSEATLGWT